MSDTRVTYTQNLLVEAAFVDGDTRTINLENPKSTISASELATVAAAMEGVLIGDKQESAFSGLKSVKRRNQSTTTITF